MKIPVITGQGRHIDLDSDDYLRLITLPDACSGIAPGLWELFTELGSDRVPDCTDRAHDQAQQDRHSAEQA